MKPRRQTIKFKDGDVKALPICRGEHAFRLAIYDEDTTVPLIQAKLGAAERQAIRKALGPDKQTTIASRAGTWRSSCPFS